MKPVAIGLLTVLTIFQGVPAAAQPPVDFAAAADAANASSPQAVPGPPNLTTIDPEYARARMAYDKFALQHAQRTFVWQYWSGIAVFGVVMTTVIVGLWLSYLHFYQGRRGGGQLKMSANGVEINSPVIGLLILVVSLGFFYLYLSQVYPITEVKP